MNSSTLKKGLLGAGVIAGLATAKASAALPGDLTVADTGILAADLAAIVVAAMAIGGVMLGGRFLWRAFKSFYKG